MKILRAHLGAFFTAAAFALMPRAAMAVQCNVAHTFITGEPLVQNVLNANPQQFASCLANIDYRNIGASGLFASQIVPQSAAQATFGGAFPYTFQLPPNFSQPLPLTSGGTGTNNGYINNIRFSGNPGTTILNAGLAAVANTSGGGGYSISIDSAGFNPLYLGNYNTGMPSINMGVYGGWAVLQPDSFAIPTSSSATNRMEIKSTGFTLKNVVQSTNLILRGATGNVAWYDNTRGRQSDVEIDFANQRLQSDGFNVNDPANGTAKYAVPFDAQSTSNSARTHLEHGSGGVTLPAANSAVCAAVTFAKPFTAAPNVTVGMSTGGAYTSYANAITNSGFQACVNTAFGASSSGGTNSGDVNLGYQWIALGE